MSRLCPPHLGPIVLVCQVMTGDVTVIRQPAERDLAVLQKIFLSFVLSFILFFLFGHIGALIPKSLELKAVCECVRTCRLSVADWHD